MCTFANQVLKKLEKMEQTLNKTTQLAQIHQLEWLTVKQAALLLNKSPRTIYEWVEKEQIPAKKASRKHYIHKNHLIRHLPIDTSATANRCTPDDNPFRNILLNY